MLGVGRLLLGIRCDLRSWLDSRYATRLGPSLGRVSLATQITKGTLGFLSKACWTLMWHRLRHIMGFNILSLERVVLADGIMVGYEIDVAKILEMDICDRL